jgi:hypothetical protein
MNRTIFKLGIIFLLVGITINPAVAVLNPDDTTPPVSTHSLDPPDPNGENGWYVSDVNVTLNATDDMSGVKEIKYRVNDGYPQTITGSEGTFLITQADDKDDCKVEYWAIDNFGNVESSHTFYIDMDQTKPTIDLTYEVIGGNPWIGWDIIFTATCSDATSGMDHVEFYLNGELRETVYGYGPTYEWEYHYPEFSGKIIVRGLICNPVITDEYVKFYALIVRVRAIFDGDINIDARASAYDEAGNWEDDIIEDPCPQTPIKPGFYLFQNIILPNNYTGYIGKYFISTIFNNCSYHKIKTFRI